MLILNDVERRNQNAPRHVPEVRIRFHGALRGCLCPDDVESVAVEHTAGSGETALASWWLRRSSELHVTRGVAPANFFEPLLIRIVGNIGQK